MKNLLLLSPILALFALGCSKSKLLQEKIAEHPNYYQQWFDEHKNENGEIPLDLTDKWADFDKKTFQDPERSAGETVINKVTNLAADGVHGGRTRAILVSSLDSNLVFVGSVSGGLWRSQDGGNSWTPINDHASSLSVTCITENPFNPKEIYFGTGEVRGAAQPPGNGIFKSEDGGLTFNRLASTAVNDFRFCNYIRHSLVDSSTVWIGTSTALFFTKNSGKTWSKSSLSGSISGIISFPDSSMMASVIGKSIYKSAKGEKTPFVVIPDSVSSFPKASLGRILIENCKSFPNVVYAFFTSNSSASYTGETDRGVFRSNNGGLSWTRPFKDTIRVGSSYQAYCQMLGVSAYDTNYVVVGAVNARFSKSGGKTWASCSPGHADNHTYAHVGNAGNFFYGNDGGIYKNNWATITTTPKDKSKGYTSSQYYAGNFGPTGLTCLGGTQDNGTWRYVNGVLTKINGGDGAYSHISQQNPLQAYYSTQNGATYRRDNYVTNTGTTTISPKIAVAEGVSFINEHQINYADGKQLYYRSNKGIWRTIDRGSTWARLNKSEIAGITAVGVSEEVNPSVYVCGANVFYRIDSAATCQDSLVLTNLASKMPATIKGSVFGNVSFHPNDPSVMYVGFSTVSTQSRVWRVNHVNTDTLKWENLGANLPKELSVYQVQAHPDAADSVFFAATTFGLYVTTNGGTTWEKELRVPNVPIFEMKLRKSDKQLFLFTHGRGVWNIELQNLNNVSPVKNVALEQNWTLSPNPVTQRLMIDSDFDVKSAQVFDLNGREILSFQNEKQLDVSNLTSGFYVLRIYSEKGFFAMKKFVKE